ncbi:MAG: homogentisate 1,2-dioxygenase [Proteobacteria bacterium]|nr:homogentisate 1,2-dioxygenase [Pseudomonadota bacterium]
MIDYRKLGVVSEKPHTVFEHEGKMVAEHVFTRDGFSDLYSILYQKRAPTHEVKVEAFESRNKGFPHEKDDGVELLKRRHLKTPKHPSGGTLLESRKTLFFNDDCTVGIARPDKQSDEFFINGDCDELYFVAEGCGVLQTIFGEIDFREGDYLFLPKAVACRFRFAHPLYLFVVEGTKEFGIPREFRLSQGQLRLDAPFTHRDFRSPSRLLNLPESENPPFVVKKLNRLSKHEYTEFPYQVIGWDGWCYPFAFSVHAYQPKTSSVHLPPTIHTVFSARGFYMMNFVPRILDYAKNAIPCPYPHSSVDCDEILFYVKGEFTSRKGIEQYSMSYHPCGIPHGPHPEKYEKSVGVRETNELAVMVDTFAPLKMTRAAVSLEDDAYHYSWNTKEHL